MDLALYGVSTLRNNFLKLVVAPLEKQW